MNSNICYFDVYVKPLWSYNVILLERLLKWLLI